MTDPAGSIVTGAPVVVIVRDGWGQNPHPEHDAFNAIKLAHTPVDEGLRDVWPGALIHTSGEDVGLPDGTMGNSEVGHQNIGAGRIVDQDSVRISRAIRDGSFFKNEALVEAIEAARDADRSVHLMGLASDAGVHALLTHLYACLELCKRLKHERVLLHLFTDGRDTGPAMGLSFIRQIEEACQRIGVGQIASIIGRYWAMDRDNRWDRVALAYDCLTGRSARGSAAPLAPSALETAQDYYDHPSGDSQCGDEFITPTMIGSSSDDARATRIKTGDTVVFYNFRGDRPREISRAFVYPQFQGTVDPSPENGERGFDRGPRLDLRYVTMTAYAQDLAEHVSVAFPKQTRMKNIAGAYISSLGLTQFRCAETEKFPHVTFFFNDYRDEPFEGETRRIVQSPKVATYDLAPQMSAAGVRDAVLERLGADDCEPFIIVNFANADMVGHTGKLDAVIKAVEMVDTCVGQIVDAALARGGSLIVTADHGNAEQTWSPENNSPHTSHTTYDVPLLAIGDVCRGRSLRTGGRLADIMPTALEMAGLAKPEEMTGASMLV